MFVALNIAYVFNRLWRLSACLDHKNKCTRLYEALKFLISGGNLDKTDTECRSQRLHVYFSWSMKIVTGECTAKKKIYLVFTSCWRLQTTGVEAILSRESGVPTPSCSWPTLAGHSKQQWRETRSKCNRNDRCRCGTVDFTWDVHCSTMNNTVLQKVSINFLNQPVLPVI